MKILIIAFDPFGGEKKNPALEAIKLLPEHIKNHQITKLEIPTVFHKSSDKIADKLEQEYFDAVIAIGQAGGRFNLTPERVGININDARIPDNENNQPIDIPIQQDGAPAYFSNLPVKKMTQAIKDAGIPAALSNTAGTFVCNHILYQLGYLQATKYPDLQFGFIHVPFIPEQVIDKPDKPSMSLSSIVTGLEAAIGVISEDNQDIKKALGEIH
ncbi:pyroglutamyl-peptidase I [Staphylococcus condimenti]|uniref:Pyroglutamyl-peptidase I n=2 Tax=Staphylococcus condimenti TaxID=70255 RepID=A0AB37H4V9_9STAP|nr:MULTISPECIES: pyroglutamyl-peptidase I [Staphylococcus]AMY04596.1 pyroglutamyl-peptidase I [Staphylococcus condimenti]APR60834.1 pyroglutamyl-peptidase I [Staphylococcus condimenti]MDK8644719.1 pyroglutamyl-peptidase I [Staphylococcus condimenti]OFO98977.1 pyroglutamyl-peptidase I [Staphylococcus sp. HMSC065E08]PNZ57079.1 pyroglutamyl-peptidase I [Staphylococcus condimenti]